MSRDALDRFGEAIVRDVRDEAIADWHKIVNNQMKSERAQRLRDQLSNFSEEQRAALLAVVPGIVDTVVHHLMQCLEDNDDIEVSVTIDGQRVQSLREVRDGLAGELYSEQGWIARFSRFEN
jgi:hypothetical protein